MKLEILMRSTAVVLLSLVLSGCVTSLPTRYFILTPQALAAPPRPDSPVIVVDPVEIPPYLNRPQIVLREGKNHLQLSPFDLWGDTLRANISQVLLENLSLLLGTDRLFSPLTLGQERPTLRIFTQLIQFEPRTDGTIVLQARWRIVQQSTGKTLILRNTHLVLAPVDAKDYESMVAGMSDLLVQLSQEMARELSTVKERANP